MIFFGLPPTVANGTNRVGLLLGNASSVIRLHRKGKLELGQLKKLFLPVMAGAIVGAYMAVTISDVIFKPLLGFVILFVTLLSVYSSSRGIGKGLSIKKTAKEGCSWSMLFWFFLVGFYGGFIQIGVGFILIFAFSYITELDLVRVNALKGVITLVFLAVSLIVFSVNGKINWPVAGVFAAGTFVGGALGAGFQVKKGDLWIRRIIVIMGIGMSVKLLWTTFF
jgi:uncharacterized protein